MTRRGALLLELLVALAIFVGSATAVLAMVRKGVEGVGTAGEMLWAADLAASAYAQIEAGIASAATLDGPVPVWVDESAGVLGDDLPPMPSGWELEIDTQPAEFGNLTRLSVTARRVEGGAAFTVEGLIKTLTPADLLIEEDELARELEEAERRDARSNSFRERRRRP